jgi:hypothetical protein
VAWSKLIYIKSALVITCDLGKSFLSVRINYF